MELAQAAAEHLSKQSCFQAAAAASPGFINLTLSGSYLLERTLSIWQDPATGIEQKDPIGVEKPFACML